MNKCHSKPIALAAAILLALSGPTGVLAGNEGHGKPGHGHYAGKPWKQHGHHGGRHGKYYDKPYRYGGYRGHHGHGRHVTKYKYRYDDGNDGEKFLIGLLFGGIAGYALGQHEDGQQGYDPYPARAPVYGNAGYSAGGGACLQQREYQNKVIVGGRTVDAYGTACLQPDGSWRYGPVELAPY
jgi:hypothetical protein